jgi:SpoVK/Ycf46/Vps4 family AAA+-type ATPase
MSGSDLQQIVNEAALLAVRECYDGDHNHSSSTTDVTYTTRRGRWNMEEPDRATNNTDTGSDNHVVTQQHLENAIRRHRQRSGQVQK